MDNNIILIGFMGAGKTSVGRACAQGYGLQLLDTDQLIEEEEGMSISQIFGLRGEEAFRLAETRILESLQSRANGAVISVGGGLPLREENRILLRKLGRVVFLRVRKETVLWRLAGDISRPLLRGGDAGKKVHDLLEYRNPIYAQAAHDIIDTDEKTPEEIAALVMETVFRGSTEHGCF